MVLQLHKGASHRRYCTPLPVLPRQHARSPSSLAIVACLSSLLVRSASPVVSRASLLRKLPLKGPSAVIVYSSIMNENQPESAGVVQVLISANSIRAQDSFGIRRQSSRMSFCESVGRGFEPRPPHRKMPDQRPFVILGRLGKSRSSRRRPDAWASDAEALSWDLKYQSALARSNEA
jgi:hypothetical protein